MLPYPNSADSHQSREQAASLPIQNVTCANADWKFVPNFLDPRIRHLDITRTAITDLKHDLSNYPSLQTLVLSHNRISAVVAANFRLLSQLTVVDLSYNQLEVLTADVFKHSPNLLSLNLSHNHISHMHPEVLLDLPLLTDLDLSNNHLVGTTTPVSFIYWQPEAKSAVS